MAVDLAEPSGRYLDLHDRARIEVAVELGFSNARIARMLGRHRSTIGRELERNRTRRRKRREPRADGRPHPRGPARGRPLRRSRRDKRRYQSEHAQSQADARARRPKQGKLAANPALRRRVQDELTQRWSPQQIAHRLRIEFSDCPEMWVSHETIYRSLFVQGRGELRRDLTRCLRTGRAVRRPQRARGPRIADPGQGDDQ